MTDSELDKLNFLEKKNPRNQGWGTMKLVLLSEVEELSRKKFKDQNELESEKEKRQVAQLDRKVDKGRKKRESEIQAEKLERKVSKIARKMESKYEPHEHAFDESKKQYRESDCTFLNTCLKCGFIKEYQEF